MKKSSICFLLITLMACNSDSSDTVDFSTLDSNTVRQGDSTPPILYLDSALSDTSFDVALDSTGPAINPEDTNYSRKK